MLTEQADGAGQGVTADKMPSIESPRRTISPDSSSVIGRLSSPNRSTLPPFRADKIPVLNWCPTESTVTVAPPFVASRVASTGSLVMGSTTTSAPTFCANARQAAAGEADELDTGAIQSTAIQHFVELVELVKGNERVVAVARAHHGSIPMAVVSGGPRVAVEAALERAGILDLFDALVTIEDVTTESPLPTSISWRSIA
jgi:hypothetical protein